jgi:hypothetical protein
LKELAEQAMKTTRLMFAVAPMPARGVQAASPSELQTVSDFSAHIGTSRIEAP